MLSRDEVPADLVENERRIAEAQAKEEGKPEQALSRIVEGRVNSYFKDVALLDQPSVTDGKLSVGKQLEAAGVTDASRMISYCGSGVTACHNLLVAEHAGLGTGRLFPGSWSQYSHTDRPVETSPTS